MYGLYDRYPYFEAYLSDGKKYMFDLSKKCIVKTACNCNHGDWKTNSVHPRTTIPADTEVEVTGHCYNFYGHYLQVNYDGTFYDIRTSEVNYVRMENK